MFGEIGNGKSTTGNQLIKIISQQETNQRKRFKSQMFVASKSTQAVTKELELKKFNTITLIDTPGFSDTDPKRTDIKLFS